MGHRLGLGENLINIGGTVGGGRPIFRFNHSRHPFSIMQSTDADADVDTVKKVKL